MLEIKFNTINRLKYRNHRGEVAVRDIVPTHMWFGSNEWHTEEQWIVEAYDRDKKEYRSFSLEGFRIS